MNNCTFIGRIGKDAVTRHTQDGKPVTGWSLAVDNGFGDKKQTVWIDCTWWGERSVKVAEYIRKGDRIGVSGELGTREHDGKTYVTLRIAEVTLLGEKKDAGSAQPKQQARQVPPNDDDDPDDRIPF